MSLPEFLQEQVLALDPANPQIAARLLRVLSRWERYDEGRQAKMRAVLGSTYRSTAKHRDNNAPCLSSMV